MPKRSKDTQNGLIWNGLGLSLIAGGALIGASFLGDAQASARGAAGTYILSTLPDNYGTTGLFTKGLESGARQAQDGYYCYYYTGYYDCCYDTDNSDYCCYYYGYYYCYGSKSSRSDENINEGAGFAALRPTQTPPKKPVNAGGFTAVEKEANIGSLALNGGGFAGTGSPTNTAGYNNTFL